MSQLHKYVWTFGDHSRISFPSGGDPIVEPDHAFSSSEGCASISGASGQLLFYTDGIDLFDSGDTIISGPPLGGDHDSTHSAVIVPPAGGGSLFHIFAAPKNGSGPLMHTTVSVSGSTVTRASTPTAVANMPVNVAEHIGATSHIECDKYWLLAMGDNRRLYAMLIDSDAGVATPAISIAGLPNYTTTNHTMKIAPSGNKVALCFSKKQSYNHSDIFVFSFDRSTAAASQISYCQRNNINKRPYGMEFSPDERFLYFTVLEGHLKRHNIGSTNHQSTIWSPGSGKLGALQMGPNGKIYGVNRGSNSLFSIDTPDANSATAVAVGLQQVAQKAGGGDLLLNQNTTYGLPTFTLVAPECSLDLPDDDSETPTDTGRCAELLDEVNGEINAQFDALRTPLPYCEERDPALWCEPADLPDINPVVSVIWARSDCDNVESDDVETMLLTVSNPYSNLAFCDVNIMKVSVTKPDGSPVELLPDGTPSVEPIPRGPFCFGKIEPCSYTTRELVIRTRGAAAGDYRLKVEGVCFDICIHKDLDECFVMEVCPD